MSLVDKVMEKVGWKPPTSKESGITDSDTLFSDKIINYVEMFYNDDIRIVNANIDRSHSDYRYSQESNKTKPVRINLKSSYHLSGDRTEDPKYNDKDSPLQIHCFGDSWTYGWDIKQEETFVIYLETKILRCGTMEQVILV